MTPVADELVKPARNAWLGRLTSSQAFCRVGGDVAIPTPHR